MIGQRLGHFRIIEKLGEGGMGVVYRARDERLDRDVALKVLPRELVSDDAALARFRREALALSKLNHSNIAAIYDFDSQDGVAFLVMECVPGCTLAEKISGGALPEKEIASLGVQVAEALEEAHEHGVVHRDLKPGNILITPKGRAKVLDFGLAKLLPAGSGDLTRSLVETKGIAGTLPYMPPEQLRGEPVDARSDIYSAGTVLYEMSTGQRAFREDLSSRLADAILHNAPLPPRALNSRVSPELERIILKCLDKNPEHRFQSAKELAVDLRRLGISSSSQTIESAAVSHRFAHPLPLLLGSVVVLCVAIGALLLFRGKSSKPTEYVQITNFADSAAQPSLSPDGRLLTFIRGGGTFATTGQIYIKLLPDGEPVQLTHDDSRKMDPVFSPDGSRIAYTSIREWNWDTWVVPVLGGAPQPLLPNASGLTWVAPGRVMFSEITTGINMKIATSTESRGEERDVYEPKSSELFMAHRSYISPDHRWVLVAQMDNRGWLPCALVSFDGSSPAKQVGPAGSQCTSGAWSPDGKWVYFSANTGSGFHIWRQRFAGGTPEQITFGATQEQGIGIAPDGESLITSIGVGQSTVWLHDGNGDRMISGEGYAFTPAFSRDGSKLYYLVRGGASRAFLAGELWEADVATGQRERLLPDFLITRFDVSADGTKVVFAANDANAKSAIWLAPLDRRSPPRQLTTAEAFRPLFGTSGEILFLQKDADGSFIYRMKEDGTSKERVVPDPVIYLISSSPDGRWVIAWVPNKDSTQTQAVVAYPTRGGRSVVICTGCSGTGPANLGAPIASWSPDGRAFYFTNILSSMERQTFRIPLAPGAALPPFPPSGLDSTKELLALPGVRTIDESDIFPGPNPSIYAFSRMGVQQNLYRVRLP